MDNYPGNLLRQRTLIFLFLKILVGRLQNNIFSKINDVQISLVKNYKSPPQIINSYICKVFHDGWWSSSGVAFSRWFCGMKSTVTFFLSDKPLSSYEDSKWTNEWKNVILPKRQYYTMSPDPGCVRWKADWIYIKKPVLNTFVIWLPLLLFGNPTHLINRTFNPNNWRRNLTNHSRFPLRITI